MFISIISFSYVIVLSRYNSYFPSILFEYKLVLVNLLSFTWCVLEALGPPVRNRNWSWKKKVSDSYKQMGYVP